MAEGSKMKLYIVSSALESGFGIEPSKPVVLNSLQAAKDLLISDYLFYGRDQPEYEDMEPWERDTVEVIGSLDDEELAGPDGYIMYAEEGDEVSVRLDVVEV